MKISTSKKRAVIFFSDPERGQCAVQESPGEASEKLRNAIRIASDAFWAAYTPAPNPPEVTQ